MERMSLHSLHYRQRKERNKQNNNSDRFAKHRDGTNRESVENENVRLSGCNGFLSAAVQEQEITSAFTLFSFPFLYFFLESEGWEWGRGVCLCVCGEGGGVGYVISLG